MRTQRRHGAPGIDVVRSAITRREFMIGTAAAAATVGLTGDRALARDAAADAVLLAPPRVEGGVSVEAALRNRRSVRRFAPASLTLEEVGQLCWAAQGVTDEHGHRTAPSARASYPLEIYVAAGMITGLATGLYRYRPASHSLQLVAPRDHRGVLDAVVSQGWNRIGQAAAVFVITGTVERMAASEYLHAKRAAEFMWVEAGLAAQGLFLQATALGLGSVYTGGFRPSEAKAALGLPRCEDVLGILPVGRRT